MQVHAFVFEKAGPPTVMKWRIKELGDPGAGEALVRHTAIGLNYIDTYHRSGLYPIEFPSGIGLEAAGVVEAVGKGVTHVKKGDRVAYGSGPLGAYSEARIMPAATLIKLPKGVDDETAAAMMLKGMTVEYLINRTYKVKKDEWVLFQAAAGGVGRLLCQWTAHIGATVIGTVGSEDKAAAAKASGCAHTILYRETEFKAAVMEITKGRGVDVAYDSVGADTFSSSLECLVPCGHLVNYGQSSGPVEPLAMTTLAANSLTVSRPILFHYMADPAQYQSMAQTVFDMLGTGILKPDTPMPLPLADASKAHDILEGRTGGGALVLIP